MEHPSIIKVTNKAFELKLNNSNLEAVDFINMLVLPTAFIKL
jgi:hypothetical protein